MGSNYSKKEELNNRKTCQKFPRWIAVPSGWKGLENSFVFFILTDCLKIDREKLNGKYTGYVPVEWICVCVFSL